MLTKKGKNLISSPAARSLIHALPENITLPDLPAVWETYFRKVINYISKKSSKKSNVKCPRCGTVMFLRNGKNGVFWGCSNYPECKMIADDKNGKPIFRK